MTHRYTALIALFTLLATTAVAQVPNDDCASATPITCGETLSGSTSLAQPDEAIACGTSISAPGVWYVLQGTGAQVTATTCPNNGYDTKLNVYRGNCGTITCVVGNDDSNGGLCSTVGFAAGLGETFYILVQGYNGAVGTFELALTCTPFTFDVCSGALPISCGATATGTTADATADSAPVCVTDITAPGVWYTFPGSDAQITVSTCPNNGYDTKLNVYSGSCAELVCVSGNDDIVPGTQCSNVVFNATAGTDYYVLVQGYDGATGDFELAVTCVTCGLPLSTTVDVLDVSATITWSSSNAGSDYTLEYGPAGFTPGTGTVITGTYGVDGPPVTITGLDPASDYEFYVQEDCGGGDLSPVSGPNAFTTLAFPPAVNALCGGALPIACDSTVTGDTQQGAFTPGPACGAANISTRGLWYAFTGNGQVVTLSTCAGSAYDTKISVFSGDCTAPICVAGSDDSPNCPGNASRATFPTVNGTAYLVLVHGYNNAQGTFTLAMTCAEPCAPVENDECATATLQNIQFTGGCETSTGTNVCAFSSAVPNPPCDPFGNMVDVWYAFNTGWTANLSLLLSSVDAAVVNAALYTGCDGTGFVECWQDVTAPIDLSTVVPNNTDVWLRIWNGGGDDAGSFNVCLEGDFNVGLLATDRGTAFQLFPVPVINNLTAQPLNGIRHLTVVDLQGRTLLHTSTNGQRSALIDVNTLASGAYVLLGDGAFLGRFVKE